MKAHELKTDPKMFWAVFNRHKEFELRFNDRDYAEGDTLILKQTRYSAQEMKEGKPLEYTGNICEVCVTYVLKGPVYGLMDGWVIMGFYFRHGYLPKTV